jgi:hypothetical protein
MSSDAPTFPTNLSDATFPVDWNIPKHLARFVWQEDSQGSLTVKVYPSDMGPGGMKTNKSTQPLLQVSIRNIRLPSFPFKTTWLNKLRVNTSAVFSPLPHGGGRWGELPGTDRWTKISPIISSKRSKLVVVDMSQRDDAIRVGHWHPNFWPGRGRWRLGMMMEVACMVLDLPETWRFK